MSGHTPGDQLDLDAIEARAQVALRTLSQIAAHDLLCEEVPALVAEVRRLRAVEREYVALLAAVSHTSEDPDCKASPCEFHETLARAEVAEDAAEQLRAAVQFKQGIIDDLSATIERLEAEVSA